MDSYNSFEESDLPVAGIDFQNPCNLGLHDFKLLLSVKSLGTAKLLIGIISTRHYSALRWNF